MAKNKIILLCIFLFVGSISILGQNPRDRVIQIYSGEIGTREATGRNDGERVEMYLSAVGHRKGAPWCAAFVSWVYIEANITAAKSAWSPAWFPTQKTIYTRGSAGNQSPLPADVFGIWFQKLGRVAHVGFVHEWQSNTQFAITVEGNTNDAGSREGDGVYKKRRLKSQIYKISRWL